MSSSSKCIIGSSAPAHLPALALFDTQNTRTLEQTAAATLPAHTLMQRAGLALAQLTLAVAPHAKTIWIACGPGNNGGDGFEAAMHLQRWGKDVVVSCIDSAAPLPTDAAMSRTRAQQAGVQLTTNAPAEFDVCIDAIFGIGALRPLQGTYQEWVQRMNGCGVPVVAADLPTGLDADTGSVAKVHVQASHTLSLLTLKPGLFTTHGRDACGEIWFNNLDVEHTLPANAVLNPTPPHQPRMHNTHKGSYGDIAIVGGAAGMTGAALLAATAALHGGAGRVFVADLDNSHPLRVDATQPELMFRAFNSLDLTNMVVVAGCGGGESIAQHLGAILQKAPRLVLDADALNAIAAEPHFQELLRSRAAESSALTPHPLEAARLLQTTTNQVQSNRVAAAESLAQRFACTVVLKGSGTVIASPERTTRINTTGNANLATAGTGDVLAGLMGALFATHADAYCAACRAVYQHGLRADQWCTKTTDPLTALRLAQVL